jgi:hypothetical protein
MTPAKPMKYGEVTVKIIEKMIRSGTKILFFCK